MATLTLTPTAMVFMVGTLLRENHMKICFAKVCIQIVCYCMRNNQVIDLSILYKFIHYGRNKMSYEVGARERSLCESGVSDLVFVLVPYTILSCCQLQRNV